MFDKNPIVKLKELTNNEALIRIGFGTFVDKLTSPQTEMTAFRLEQPYDHYHPNSDQPIELQAPFLYKNVNPLTDNIDEYTRKMATEKVSGNLDGPEGALEAMFQAVACRVSFGSNINDFPCGSYHLNQLVSVG